MVAPEYSNRASLGTSPPLFILRVPETAGTSGIDEVIEALYRSLFGNGKLVPLARLAAEDDSTLLSEIAGAQLRTGAPENMTPDRYPNFLVMRDLITYIRQNPRAWRAGPQTRELRLHASEQRAKRGGLLGFTQVAGPDGGWLWGFLMKLVWRPLVQRMPRRVWAAWTSRKVMRDWLGAENTAGGGRDLFRAMNNGGALWSTQLGNDPNHEEALQQLDRLLWRALLEDLRSPVIGRLLPGRRRRTARPVLLVELPPPAARGSRAAERFLRSVHQTPTAKGPGPLVVAVGQPSEHLLADLGDPEQLTFTQASIRLSDQAGPPVLVAFSDDAMAKPRLQLPRVNPRTFRFSRMVPTAIMAGVTVLVMAGTSLGIVQAFDDHDCIGGVDSVAESARADPVPVHSKAWYDAAIREIDKQNKRAEQAAVEGRTVRTVVAFVSSVPTDENESRFDGMIPELRGIAMWQRKLLDDAVSNDSAVRLRVEVWPTGQAFQNAEAEARKLAKRVADEGTAKNIEDYTRVVGVLGYAQSRDETQAALRVLGDAKIPTIGTTATADEMLTGNANRSYWPFTPTNSTEASIAANFAGTRNIVAIPNSKGDCSPARHALVIESSTDLYSRSLADKFRAEFQGTSQVFNFNQEGDFDPPSPSGATNMSSADELASQLCRQLKAKPGSIVYWSARARDFTAFINAMQTQGTCIDDDITVLGGNELTNVAQTGAFNNKHWLRLYYSAHRLPATDVNASDQTKQFVDDYTAFVKRTTKGIDPWIQDGHSAVSYDAFHVLSQAVDQAHRQAGTVSRESVLVALGGGITFNGATGFVSYDGNSNAAPVDKTLVLLRQLGSGPKTVLVCGAYDQGASSEAQGPPCTR
ncbi:hypothetical protein Acsp03_58690 [Actinomadura sp. NBRC 104412]|nr:hypothetical protein Acsp03_58690 [Actinomadura sp. NBRC 104412]